MANRIKTKPGGICTINKDDFTKVFEDVPKITITSAIDAKNKFETIREILSNVGEDWNKRINQLKTIRSVIIYGEKVMDRTQIIANLMQLIGCLETSVRDLRSQILREAAITCSFIVSKYGIDAHSIGEDILPAAMSQVAVSTKIMATAAATLTEFIVEYIQTRQIFTILSAYSTSKDKSQRRQLATLLEIIIEKWSDKIKRQILRQICEILKSAICDADSETRVAGRKAFGKLEDAYPDEAEEVYQTLDVSKKKMLRPDAASSWASVNSDRGSVPIRSKLSIGSKGGPLQNISAKFLAQRSASAIDPNIGDRIPRALKPPTANRLVRPKSTKTIGRVDTSPAGMKILPRPLGVQRTRASSITSQPDSGPSSPTFDRKRSPDPYGAFVSSLSSEEANKFLKTLNTAKRELRQPNNKEDDEFLLPSRRVVSPRRVKKENGACEMSPEVTIALKACCSSSISERKEGVRMMMPIAGNPNLNQTELKNVGNCLNRLLSDVTNSMILEVYAIFIRTHAHKLEDWLRLALSKLFPKKGNEVLPNMRKQIDQTLETILESFDPYIQLVTVCELMCDPIHLMVPKARIALLEYLDELFREFLRPGSNLRIIEVKGALKKMFGWVGDQRQSGVLLPYIENVICSMFCCNEADFCALLAEFESDEKQWAHQILQRNGLQNGISFQRNSSGSAEQSVVLPEVRKKESVPYLGSFNTTATNSILSSWEEQSTSRLMDKLNSTVNLSGDTFEKAQTIQGHLEKMGQMTNLEEQNEAISAIYSMLSDGSFAVLDHCYAKLLLCLFEILSKSKSENNRRMALRVLGKICVVQATKLFDSTEIAVCKVLDTAVNSSDPTTAVAVEDCLRTLATHLPISKIVNIAHVILNQTPLDDERAALVLKMVTRLFEEFQSDELQCYVDDIAPVVIKAYNSTSSAVRKNVVYCLVAMVNRIGNKKMDGFLGKVPKAMTNLIQVYVNRSISSSLPRV